MAKTRHCEVCRKEIVESLFEIGAANSWICFDCSGLTLEDLDDRTDDEISEDRVHLMRQFHGKD